MTRRRHPVLRTLVVASLCGAVLAGVGALLFADVSLGPEVGVVEIQGVIEDGTATLETLEHFRTTSHVVAVVLRLDSPGGAVGPAQEIWDAVGRLRAKKPVIASLGNVAASAAYYVASAADVIVSNPGTLTGSIGAIMELPNAAGLAEKLGVDMAVVKGGAFKDIGSPVRPLTDAERAVLQTMVDDVVRQFVEAVAQGRKMPVERVRALADGRPLSGAQAQASGLVDELGGLDTAVRLAWERAGKTGEPRVHRVHGRRWPWWARLVGAAIGPGGPGLGGGLLLLYGGGLPR
ncbi:MAG: signal peptide peptidase SppA [Candidatus Binatia bacterium]